MCIAIRRPSTWCLNVFIVSQVLLLLAFTTIEASQAKGDVRQNKVPRKPAFQSQPLDPNNILVSIEDQVREYTPSGTLVQTIQFDYGGRPYYGCCPGGENLRGIVVDQYGWIDSFNGKFYPLMSRYLPTSGAFTTMGFPEWSASNSVNLGTIAAIQNFVFAADSS